MTDVPLIIKEIEYEIRWFQHRLVYEHMSIERRKDYEDQIEKFKKEIDKLGIQVSDDI